MSERDDYPADPGYGDYRQDADDAPPRRSIVGPAVVALGLAAFGGIIWYAYSQGMRAGTESVAPIVRADPSPTKVRPEQPGGMEVPHQDKLVYDRLNPTSGEAGVERLLPPPETPLERPKAAPAPAAPAAAEEPPVELAATAPEAELPPEEPPAATGAPVPLGPAAKPAAPAAAAPVQPALAQKAPAQQQAAAVPPAVPPVQAPTQAPAQVPPAAPAPQKAAPAATAPAAAAVVPAAGGVRIQIASVPSEDVANKEWQRLSRKHAGALGGLGMRIVKADLGAKGVYYRVQAGPTDEARAKSICDAMKAQSDGCILVRN